MHRFAHREFRRILIIKPSSFGDVIHALPILHDLRERFPRAHISWLISTACYDLMVGHPELDELIPFDRKRYGRIFRDAPITWEFLRFVADLRSRRFDLVIDLQGLFRSGFFALASGASARVGFANARELAWLFYNERIDAGDMDTHAIDRNLRFRPALGLPARPAVFAIPVAEEARDQVRQQLRRAGLAPGTPYVLIAPGTRWETKRWPATAFADVARTLRNDHGLAVVLAGAPDEIDVARHVADRAGQGVINLAGQTTIPQLVALVAGAAGALMNDTGPMHLAVALERPLVVIHGPTNPLRTGPYRQPGAVARLDLPCSPCYLKKLADCPHHHRCMRELSPPEVLDKLLATLPTEVTTR